MPMVYTLAHFGSEIFERLRSSKYTPSVSHSLDSSLREGAGDGCVPFIRPPKNRKIAGDFHRPYEGRVPFIGGHSLSQPFGLPAPSGREPGMGCAIQRAARKPEGCGRFSSPLRSSESFTFHHSTGYSLRRKGGGRFSSPLRNAKVFTFHHSSGWLQNPKRAILGKMALGGVIFPELPGRWCSRRF